MEKKSVQDLTERDSLIFSHIVHFGISDEDLSLRAKLLSVETLEVAPFMDFVLTYMPGDIYRR